MIDCVKVVCVCACASVRIYALVQRIKSHDNMIRLIHRGFLEGGGISVLAGLVIISMVITLSDRTDLMVNLLFIRSSNNYL